MSPLPQDVPDAGARFRLSDNGSSCPHVDGVTRMAEEKTSAELAEELKDWCEGVLDQISE